MPEHDQETERVLEVLQPTTQTNNGSYQKTISLVVVLISIFTYMHLQVQSVREGVRDRKDDIHKLEQRTQGDNEKLDTKLQTEISGLRTELSKIDKWFFWWNTNIPSLNAEQSTRLRALERDLYGTPILIPKHAAPRTEVSP